MKTIFQYINEALRIKSGSNISTKTLEETYFYFEAIEDGFSAKFYSGSPNNKLEYSIDNCKTWKPLLANDETPEIKGKSRIYFKGDGNTLEVGSLGFGKFSQTTKKFNVGGNIMSLLYMDDFINKTTLITPGQFANLFEKNKHLISAQKLILPAKIVNSEGYANMFSQCINLTEPPQIFAETVKAEGCSSMFYACDSLEYAPELPATTIGYNGYSRMFDDCKSLRIAPELPAKNISPRCYASMFTSCASLEKAPSVLPATKLHNSCYAGMFFGCEKLKEAPELPADALAPECYLNMFRKCTSLKNITMLATKTNASDALYEWVNGVSKSGIFTLSKGMTSSSLGPNVIPANWTIKEL